MLDGIWILWSGLKRSPGFDELDGSWSDRFEPAGGSGGSLAQRRKRGAVTRCNTWQTLDRLHHFAGITFPIEHSSCRVVFTPDNVLKYIFESPPTQSFHDSTSLRL